MKLHKYRLKWDSITPETFEFKLTIFRGDKGIESPDYKEMEMIADKIRQSLDTVKL